MTHADQLGRSLRDLRISVTDRCNFRCTYCMPRDSFGPDYPFLDRGELLSYEEIQRLAGVFVGLGVKKIRLTGGEPLVRRGLPKLIELLSGVEGLEDLALTTNGALLSEHAEALRDAGLQRVTISLDSVNPETFSKLSDSRIPLSRILEGIEAAQKAGLAPVKVNAVIRRGVNEVEVEHLARHFHGSGVVLRFIEYMDVGNTNGWTLDEVVGAEEILDRLGQIYPFEPIGQVDHGRVAERWRYTDGGGEFGIIASVTRPFCSGCTRMRLSPDGHLYTCLFASGGFDLRKMLRSSPEEQQQQRITHAISTLWSGRSDRYSEERRDGGSSGPKIEMSRIGG